MLLYGIFEEKGYKFEAHIPDSDTDPVAFELRIIVGADSKYGLLIPMTYVPTFGVDVGDIQCLESVLDQILQILPDSRSFGPDTVAALDRLETEIGGKEMREQHRSNLNSLRREHGQFEYTTKLFTAKFADLMGGHESMDRWMRTKMPQLGDRTPEEALRLGMAQEVVAYLLQHSGHSPSDR
jgi:hypothetical protein